MSIFDIIGNTEKLKETIISKLIIDVNKRLSPRTSIAEKTIKFINVEIRDEHLIILNFEALSHANDVISIEQYLVSTICVAKLQPRNKLYEEYVDTVRLTVSELYEKVSKKFGKDKVETTELLKDILS